MNTSLASQKTRRKLHKTVFERMKESKWGTSCKSIWIKNPWNTSHIPYLASELTKTLLPVESTNNRKIKITHHRIIQDGHIWEGI